MPSLQLPRAFAEVQALAIVVLAITASSSPAGAEEKTVGLPCENCETVFQGGPKGNWSSVPTSARIAPPEEPGESLILEGTVTGASGKPAAGIVVYAYHTNAGGIYPRDSSLPEAAARNGKLRGFARTDVAGHYRFETIRPGGYPNTDIPQHIHMHVVEPGRCTYWIDDVTFDDDPRLTPHQRTLHLPARGGNGIAVPTREGNGPWRARRDIVLGRDVPGYDACGAS